MAHEEIRKVFTELFPVQERLVKNWWPSGLNTLRLRFQNGQDYIFTFQNYSVWKFQTIECFLMNHDAEQEFQKHMREVQRCNA